MCAALLGGRGRYYIDGYGHVVVPEPGIWVAVSVPVKTVRKRAVIPRCGVQHVGADRQFEVTFEGVSVSSTSILGTPHDALPLVASLLMKATALQCAIMIGGAQMELEMTAEYTKTRVQFERPLGRVAV